MDAYFEVHKSALTFIELPFFVANFIMPSDYSIPSHWHRYVEMIYHPTGKALVTVGNDCFTAGNTELVFIHPTEAHAVQYLENTETTREMMLSFDIELIPQQLNPHICAKLFNPNPSKADVTSHIVPLSRKDGRVVQAAIGKAYAAYKSRDFGYEFVILSGITDILQLVIQRKASAINTDDSPRHLSMNTSIDFQEIVYYIHDNINKKLMMADIANEFMISYGYLARSFKKVMNVSINEYILKLRLENAKILLSNKSLKLSQIIESVGFNDTSYFIKQFKKTYGITPNYYRSLL